MTALRAALVTAGAALVLSSCARQRTSIIAAFPPGSSASPWVLDGPAWTGTLDEAAAALGNDADAWRNLSPQQVWLAAYRHETSPQRRLVVRVFAFSEVAAAQTAFDFSKPLVDAKPVELGDAGVWTPPGVLFRTGRIVVEVFENQPGWAAQLQAVYVAGLLTRNLPRGLAELPQ